MGCGDRLDRQRNRKLRLRPKAQMVDKGGDVVGPNLQLLGQYFPGYRVTAAGSLIGLGYGLLSGFVAGWSFALLRNLSVFLYVVMIERRAERQWLRRFFEYV